MDRKVSELWVQAVCKKPELIPLFYDCLMNHFKMMAFASLYIDNHVADKISDFFFGLQGLNAIPVVLENGANVDEFTKKAADESAKKLVVVSEPLYQILAKSSKLAQELSFLDQQHKKVVSRIDLKSLHPNDLRVLQNSALLLQQTFDANFKLDDLEGIHSFFFFFFLSKLILNAVWEFWNEKILVEGSSLGKFRVSKNLLDIKFVHEKFNRCTSSEILSAGNCQCRELRIVLELIGKKNQQKFPNVHMATAFDRLTQERVMQFLMSQYFSK
jgi:hypothetical protein